MCGWLEIRHCQVLVLLSLRAFHLTEPDTNSLLSDLCAIVLPQDLSEAPGYVTSIAWSLTSTTLFLAHSTRGILPCFIPAKPMEAILSVTAPPPVEPIIATEPLPHSRDLKNLSELQTLSPSLFVKDEHEVKRLSPSEVLTHLPVCCVPHPHESLEPRSSRKR